MATIHDKKEYRYYPARIRKARIMNGLSMSELATFLGVTAQAISQYELGTSRPSDAVMLKASETLGVSVEFFEKEDVTSQNGENGAAFFRRKKSVSKKQQMAFIERASLSAEVCEYLEEYVDFPPTNLPSLSIDISVGKEIDEDEMDAIADEVKQQWNIPDGPIESMSNILQEHGFIISRVDHSNEKMDAFSRWINAKPYIFLNKTKTSMRDRFDMAHELGHLILHLGYIDDDLRNSALYDLVEHQANMFASSFLLQTKTFSIEALSSSIDRLLVLKKRWKVSVSAMIYKINGYHLLTESQVEYLKRQMTMRNMWRSEPYDDEADYDSPDILLQAYEVAAEDGLTANKFVTDLHFPPSMVETICCMRKGTLVSATSSSRPKLRVLGR